MNSGQGTILVTGGAGYIGSATCKLLASRGFVPVVLDSLIRGHASAVKWGPLERFCLTDRNAVFEMFGRYQFDAVIHFASFAYVGESVEKPNIYYWNNVVGAQNLFDAMLAHSVEKIVFSSTCATYGLPEELPIGESMPQNPINPYGRSKLMVEGMLRDYADAFGFRVCALRYFNAAGCEPELEVGELHDPEPHLIPNVLAVAAGLKPCLDIFGTDYETDDGTCIRDYVHVQDLAEAHCLSLNFLRRQPGFKAFNLGYGRGFSVYEIVKVAEEVTGRQIPIRVAPRRPGDPPQLVADSSQAREHLGWVPKWDFLERIIETAWEWHKKAETQRVRINE